MAVAAPVISVLLHGLLGLSIAALAGAALRVASLTGARGLDRALAALALDAATAAGQALLLGLVSLGTSPVALSLAAGVTWLAARARLTVPSPRPAPRRPARAPERNLSRAAPAGAAGVGRAASDAGPPLQAPPASTRRLDRLLRCLAQTQPAFEGREHLVYGPP